MSACRVCGWRYCEAKRDAECPDYKPAPTSESPEAWPRNAGGEAVSDAKPYTTEEFLRDTGSDPEHYIGDADARRLVATVRALDAANARVAELVADLLAAHGDLVAMRMERDEWKARAELAALKASHAVELRVVAERQREVTTAACVGVVRDRVHGTLHAMLVLVAGHESPLVTDEK